jgi:hypothetical protein
MFDGLGNIVALCSWIKRHSLEVKKRGVWRVVWKKPKAAVGVLLLLIFLSLIISDIDNGVAVAVPLEAELYAEPDELWGFLKLSNDFDEVVKHVGSELGA